MSVPANTVHYLEIVTPEVEAAATHYSETFGWKFEPAVPELGGARLASLPDGSLCGIRAPLSPQETAVVRTYLRVDDLEAAVKRAEGSGATIALPPTPLGDRGSISIYMIGGVEQGIWEV